jgi:hypothetical protein
MMSKELWKPRSLHRAWCQMDCGICGRFLHRCGRHAHGARLTRSNGTVHVFSVGKAQHMPYSLRKPQRIFVCRSFHQLCHFLFIRAARHARLLRAQSSIRGRVSHPPHSRGAPPAHNRQQLGNICPKKGMLGKRAPTGISPVCCDPTCIF